MSLSIASNIPGYQAPTCFVTNGDVSNLIRAMIEHFKHLADVARGLLLQKFGYVLEALDRSENIRKDSVTKEFQEFISELVVFGFNSAKIITIFK